MPRAAANPPRDPTPVSEGSWPEIRSWRSRARPSAASPPSRSPPPRNPSAPSSCPRTAKTPCGSFQVAFEMRFTRFAGARLRAMITSRIARKRAPAFRQISLHGIAKGNHDAGARSRPGAAHRCDGRGDDRSLRSDRRADRTATPDHQSLPLRAGERPRRHTGRRQRCFRPCTAAPAHPGRGARPRRLGRARRPRRPTAPAVRSSRRDAHDQRRLGLGRRRAGSPPHHASSGRWCFQPAARMRGCCSVSDPAPPPPNSQAPAPRPASLASKFTRSRKKRRRGCGETPVHPHPRRHVCVRQCPRREVIA